MTRDAALAALLQTSFDLDDLRLFLLGVDASYAVAMEEINWRSSKALVTSDVVHTLDKHRLIDAFFFDALNSARPKRGEEISRLRALWIAEPATESATPATTTPPAANTRIRFVLDHAVRADRDALYCVMRDRLPEVCARTNALQNCEPLYRHRKPPGVWCGYFVRHDFNRIPFLDAASSLLAPMVDQLMVAGVHCIWDDKAYIAYWYWDSIYFAARETIRFSEARSGSTVHLECDYEVLNERLTNPIMRGIADGLWRVVQPQQERLVRQSLEDLVAAADGLLSDR